MDNGAAAKEPVFRAGLRTALRLVGSQVELARLSGIPQQTISWLVNQSDRISAEHAAAIDRATGGRVPKHELRPDLFDSPPATGKRPASKPSRARRQTASAPNNG